GELMELLQANLDETKHVVITGGEPMLQKDALIELTRRIKGELGLHISIETNGTIFSRELAGFIDLYSISPKLRNSDPDAEKLSALGLQMSGPFKYHPEKRKNLEVIDRKSTRLNSSHVKISYAVFCLKKKKNKKQKYKKQPKINSEAHKG